MAWQGSPKGCLGPLDNSGLRFGLVLQSTEAGFILLFLVSVYLGCPFGGTRNINPTPHGSCHRHSECKCCPNTVRTVAKILSVLCELDSSRVRSLPNPPPPPQAPLQFLDFSSTPSTSLNSSLRPRLKVGVSSSVRSQRQEVPTESHRIAVSRAR